MHPARFSVPLLKLAGHMLNVFRIGVIWYMVCAMIEDPLCKVRYMTLSI